MNKKRIILILLFLFIVGMLNITACNGAPTPEAAAQEEPQPLPEEDIQAEESESEDSAPPEESVPALPPEVQKMTFTTSDNVVLNSSYYPAGDYQAPLIILMHWAPGDQEDWVEIAFWLQNRGLGGNSSFSEITPWLDPSWFPENTLTYNIFTFTFRNCEGGCKSFEREKWLTDAQAAVDFAVQLEGINSENIFIVGTSIGADGAADGCAYMNQNYPDTCKGAFSLSPGNYLTIDFKDQVVQLQAGNELTPVWCLYAETDYESAPVCDPIKEGNYTAIPYPAESLFSNGHGMNLLNPNQEPKPLDLLQEALKMVF